MRRHAARRGKSPGREPDGAARDRDRETGLHPPSDEGPRGWEEEEKTGEIRQDSGSHEERSGHQDGGAVE
jgi:hypothetical protein